jgi:hypothetical protein
MREPRAWLVIVAACGGGTLDPPATPDAGVVAAPDTPASQVDLDGDGLDDAYELELAAAYLPHISLDPDDGCTRAGLVVRVRPHPQDASKVLVIYDHLFETDCGLGGHTGDNEVFGALIDPTRPAGGAPGGILALRTASHQGTACERITECSTCGDGRPACDLQAGRPVLYASKGKHGQYATRAQCPLFGTCFDQCTLNTTPAVPPLANAGEPGRPLITDLTTQGFITAANGWTEAELMHVDPWGPEDFGGAGNIAEDLVDPVFEVAPCP